MKGNLYLPYSNTKLDVKEKCDRRFFLKYHLKIKPENYGLPSPDTTKMDVGNTIHYIMEKYIGFIFSDRNIDKAEFKNIVNNTKYANNVKDLILLYEDGFFKVLNSIIKIKHKIKNIHVERFYSMDKKFTPSDKIFNTSFDAYKDMGSSYIFKPDVVIEYIDDRLTLLDFKTNMNLNKNNLFYYTNQILDYASILNNIYNCGEVYTTICNVYTGEFFKNNVSPFVLDNTFKNLKRRLNNVFESDICGDEIHPEKQRCMFCEYSEKTTVNGVEILGCDHIYSSIIESTI